MEKFWKSLDGYKSAIGIISTAIVTAAEQMGWLPAGSTQFWMLFLGALGITVIGVVHKQMKIDDANLKADKSFGDGYKAAESACPPRV